MIDRCMVVCVLVLHFIYSLTEPTHLLLPLLVICIMNYKIGNHETISYLPISLGDAPILMNSLPC